MINEEVEKKLEHVRSLWESPLFDDYLEAAAICDELVAENGKLPELLYYGSAHCITFVEAKSDCKLERYESALETVNSLLELEKKAPYLILKAAILEELGDYTLALDILKNGAGKDGKEQVEQAIARMEKEIEEEKNGPESLIVT